MNYSLSACKFKFDTQIDWITKFYLNFIFILEEWTKQIHNKAKCSIPIPISFFSLGMFPENYLSNHIAPRKNIVVEIDLIKVGKDLETTLLSRPRKGSEEMWWIKNTNRKRKETPKWQIKLIIIIILDKKDSVGSPFDR